MRIYTPEQKQNHLRLQREWYSRNKEEVKKYKSEYYLKNKEKINAKCRNYKRKNKDTQELKLSEQRVKVNIPLSVILEVLRLNKNHYLNEKEVINWNKKDLEEFNKLKDNKPF